MKLVFGVWNLPYGIGGVTTGQVANWLEFGTKRMGPYHIMQTFVDRNAGMIQKEVAEELKDILMRQRGMRSEQPMDAISTALKQAISNRAFDGTQGNKIPTKAALSGKTSRFKKGKKRGERPSFIDTGKYQSSIRVVLKP